QQVPEDMEAIDVLALAAGNEHVPESGFGRVTGSGPEQAARPLVGSAEVGGVIDPDVLWSCTTCGACVEQCPVDIEHVDHIVDMRRHQVLIESEFPSELGALFRNLENKGNPWGQNARNRLDWTKKLGFDVQIFDGELAPEVEYLFWIGCAGAFDDGAQKIVTTCPHCLNSLGREYPQLDGHYEVVHHTQLLNKLVREGKLVPVSAPE